MGFWVFMLLSNLLIPFLMIVLGRWMWKSPPKNINDILGYRTTMSRKNQDTWKFAHDYCGRLWWKVGWIMLPLSIALMLPVLGKTTDAIGNWGGILCLIQCVILIGCIAPVEQALKKNFDSDGNRRNEE
ncbi:MAG: SdpI family protein [Lachnospiraceae bacterium]|nr:SdpI family protein [Lachnospiraceae bacterium]